MSEEVKDKNTENITEEQFRINKNLEIITKTLKDVIYTIPKPNESVRFEGGIAITSSAKSVSKLKIKNPYKRKTILKEIIIVPDNNFRNNGILVIETNDVKLYDSKVVGYFKNIGVNNLVLPHGIELQRDEEVKFFIKNIDNVTPIEISARVMFTI